jgi:hypothetical protein
MDFWWERAVHSHYVLFTPECTQNCTGSVQTNLFEAGERSPASNKFGAKQIRGLVLTNVSSLLGFRRLPWRIEFNPPSSIWFALHVVVNHRLTANKCNVSSLERSGRF